MACPVCISVLQAMMGNLTEGHRNDQLLLAQPTLHLLGLILGMIFLSLFFFIQAATRLSVTNVPALSHRTKEQ